MKAQTFQENWYLKFNHPSSPNGVWLRMNLLSGKNGFRRIAEVSAIYFYRDESKETKKIAVKQTYDLKPNTKLSQKSARIGDSLLTENTTQGKIQSKGNTIVWDLNFLPSMDAEFNPIPQILRKSRLIKNTIKTLSEELLFTGTVRVNDQTIEFKHAPGMLRYEAGSRYGYSWIWSHCNSFVNEAGEAQPCIFEGLSLHSQFGPIRLPKFSSFYINYQGKTYSFNTVRDTFHKKSKNTLNEWIFQADRGDLSFRGHVRAEHKDFAGLTYEDTNGSFVYGANSAISNLRILVYRKGKLEATLIGDGTAALEITARKKNPYVPVLI